jgi:hypothetical protein
MLLASIYKLYEGMGTGQLSETEQKGHDSCLEAWSSLSKRKQQNQITQEAASASQKSKTDEAQQCAGTGQHRLNDTVPSNVERT